VRQGYNPQTLAVIREEQAPVADTPDVQEAPSLDEDTPAVKQKSSIQPMEEAADEPAADIAATCIAYPITQSYKTDTSVDIFDISDKANPRKLHTLSQSGTYRDSRMVGGMLYLISEYTDILPTETAQDEPGTYVPLFAEDGTQIASAPEDIVLRPDVTWPSYTVVGGIDAAGEGVYVSQKSVYGATETVYASTDNIYLATSAYTDEETGRDDTYVYYTSGYHTQLCRLAIGGGAVEIAATGAVPGTLHNQFSLDERGGVLRVVVTEWENTWANFITEPEVYTEKMWEDFPEGTNKQTNALYTFDENLTQLGAVTDLAEGEQVFSVRFLGDVAYFVTFRQTDPLFSVDLTDPKDPRVLGALKIPGFSEYLHPYADGLLFGLGNDANEQTGARGNLKLSMFDNSDPADVTEAHKLLVEGHMYTDVASNHKAIVVSAALGLIAFPADESYLIYSYNNDAGFAKIAEIPVDRGAGASDPNSRGAYMPFDMRGLFIGNVFYVVTPNTVTAYDMDDGFAQVGGVVLNEAAWSVSSWDYSQRVWDTGPVMPLAAEPAMAE
ncbi:MAG: beta-propeller domain-containing protein, partial [Clostridiales Family XIII bacterium]|jgi:uncharacterized secreted protein with C-terminal beta-propeller domain|nr:beta-propeller domain-containing protein [Clostridiales Family XIII bacterium]